MKSRKKFLSILLTLCMMFALVPMTALAAEDATFEVIDTEGNTTQFTKIQDARKAMKDGYTLKLLKDYVSTSDYNFGISIDGKSYLQGYHKNKPPQQRTAFFLPT